MSAQIELAPIILFVYKRFEHTKKTLEALYNNPLAKESILYIYADGPKDNVDGATLESIKKTRDILKSKQWCKEVHIIEAKTNIGLTKSITEGITEILNKHGKAIIVEDDIITSPCFLTYMNEALNLYEKNDEVMTISGFVPYTTGAENLPDTYFLHFMSCWGWATWKRAWDQYIPDLEYLYHEMQKHSNLSHYNFDEAQDFLGLLRGTYQGEVDTWDIQWVTTIFLKQGFCLYPKYSVTQNIGMDGSGEHCDTNDRYQVKLASNVNVYPISIEENKYAYNYLKRFYKYGADSSLKKRISTNLKIKLKKTALYRIYSKLRYR